MSDTEQQVQEDASVVTMALAGCSILWILAASLLTAFFVALGTLACGAICDQMGPIWLASAIIFILLIGFCLWLFIAMLRKRISSGLFMAMIGIDLLMVVGLIAFAAVLGGVGM